MMQVQSCTRRCGVLECLPPTCAAPRPFLCCAADEASTSADARMMIGVKGSELYDGFSTKKDKQVTLGLFARLLCCGKYFACELAG